MRSTDRRGGRMPFQIWEVPDLPTRSSPRAISLRQKGREAGSQNL